VRAILTYHSIDPSGSVISTSPDTFAAHLDWLARSGVRVLDVASLLADTGSGPAVALTFDDGYANLATEAWPRLADRGLPASVFVPTEHVGGGNTWDARDPDIPQLPLLDWDGLARLAEAGLRVEAHGTTHTDLTTLPREAVGEEIGGAIDMIARRLGRAPEGFAYPYGAHDAAVVREAAARCRWAATTVFGALTGRASPHRLPRLDAYYFRRPGTLGVWGGIGFRLRIRGIGAVRAVRRGFAR
jgi:peptidoglycan/xylan/chitin deacetylase (PgdA/CDA1 family)